MGGGSGRGAGPPAEWARSMRTRRSSLLFAASSPDLQSTPAGGGVLDFHFALAGRDGWKGRVSDVEVAIDRPWSGRAEVRDVRRAAISPAAPGQYPMRARLDLDREWRAALLLLPGQSETWAPAAGRGGEG